MQNNETENKIGIIGIVIDDLSATESVNEILHEHSSLFLGRMGIPCKERGVAVITLIADGTIDNFNAVTGKLGRIKGCSVKAIVTKSR